MSNTPTTGSTVAPAIEETKAPFIARILIVDDEATTVLLLRRALETAGYEVVGYANDGETGIALARETHPDLILMDCSMPGMDGIEATKQIMATRLVPIIMLTGHNDEDHINQAIEAGACTYIVKPINRARLLPAIQSAFDIFQSTLTSGRLRSPSSPDPQTVPL